MPEIITAVYENGLLRPLHPVKLSESQTVCLEVVYKSPVEPPDPEIRKQIQELLASAKPVIIQPPLRGKIEPVSEEELLKLAESIGELPGIPLSETAIEQRGPW